ncbi:riboflavin synthase [Candidatus Peregrinibacteria bacterium CG_4_10_14_0_2_um_filter_43_11]|nr:MAG: riboflavin synthase [Candidatus Peregrinibacteria bacterium CG_4_10_14_0_2_um_filter_43_11]
MGLFTGIIQTTGKVTNITDDQITIEAGDLTNELKTGSSIAIDGICLTTTEVRNGQFTADFMPETAQKTTLSNQKIDDLVNLELAMRADGRFEGHMVSGHVEGMGTLTKVDNDRNSKLLTIQIPDELTKYVIKKGSIAINGISLTVIDIQNSQITVGIIPHTWKMTNLHLLNIGDKVNVETDMMAKYIAKMI